MRPITLLLFLVGLSIPLQAQQEKIAVRTLAVTAGEYPSLWAMDSTTPVKLEFPSIQPSEPYRLTRANPFPLYQGALDAKGKPADPNTALLKLPEGGEILLLTWMQAGKVKFLPIQDTTATGKYNDWLVLNMTSKSIGIQVGATSKPSVFPTGACKPLHIDAPAGEGAPIIMASNENETWNKFFSTYWPVHADKRCLVLLVQVGDSIEVRQIFEPLERKVAKADSATPAPRK